MFWPLDVAVFRLNAHAVNVLEVSAIYTAPPTSDTLLSANVHAANVAAFNFTCTAPPSFASLSWNLQFVNEDAVL